MAAHSALICAALTAASAATSALGQSLRGEATPAELSEYPMTTVPVNKHTDLAFFALMSVFAMPVFIIAGMLWAKEKGWWGTFQLALAFVFAVWVYFAALTLDIHAVPMNHDSFLALFAIVAVMVAPILLIVGMLWAKDKGWLGSCQLVTGLIFFLWLYFAYINI